MQNKHDPSKQLKKAGTTGQESTVFITNGRKVNRLSRSTLYPYSWNEEKDIPEDRNDHTINAQQYGWIPYRNMIGFKEEEKR